MYRVHVPLSVGAKLRFREPSVFDFIRLFMTVPSGRSIVQVILLKDREVGGAGIIDMLTRAL